MNFLLSGCQNPDILRIILLFKKILNLVTILLPIALVIFLIIDLAKTMISGDEKQQGKTIKTIVNRIVFAMLIFFVPTIVNVVMSLIESAGIKAGTEYMTCFENATIEKIEEQQKKQDKEDKEYEEQLKQNQSKNDNDDNDDNDYHNQKTPSTTNKSIAQNMVSKAKEQLGTKEEPDGSNYTKFHKEFNVAKNTEWCGLFTTWVAKKTTLDDGTNLFDEVINQKKHPIENWYSVNNTISYFKDDSQLKYHESKNYTPQIGDYIFFNQHVGLVSEVRDGYVTTIEGNSENKVTSYNYKLDNTKIIGYGSWY